MSLIDSLFAKAAKTRKDEAAAEEERAARHVAKKIRKCEKQINSLAEQGVMFCCFRNDLATVLDGKDTYWSAFHKILAEQLGLKYIPHPHLPKVSWDKTES